MNSECDNSQQILLPWKRSALGLGLLLLVSESDTLHREEEGLVELSRWNAIMHGQWLISTVHHAYDHNQLTCCSLNFRNTAQHSDLPTLKAWRREIISNINASDLSHQHSILGTSQMQAHAYTLPPPRVKGLVL